MPFHCPCSCSDSRQVDSKQTKSDPSRFRFRRPARNRIQLFSATVRRFRYFEFTLAPAEAWGEISLIMNSFRCVVLCGLTMGALVGNAAEVPVIAESASGGQLIVNGKPFLILGGELGNSTAGTAAQADIE